MENYFIDFSLVWVWLILIPRSGDGSTVQQDAKAHRAGYDRWLGVTSPYIAGVGDGNLFQLDLPLPIQWQLCRITSPEMNQGILNHA